MWAQGYKFNWHNKSWQKTGVLFLEVKPEKASIYINNKSYAEKTSARIKNLLPGKYNVKVEKEGYITWDKDLTIYPNTTTFAQYIRLFKNDPPTIKLTEQKIVLFSENENNTIALVTEDNFIYIFNIEKQSFDKISFIDFKPKKIFLSQNTNKILLQTDNDWQLVDIITKKITSIKLNISQPVFDNNNTNILYVLSDRGIEKINLATLETTTILEADIINFYIKNNDLYYLNKKENNIELILTNLNSLQLKETVGQLPISQDYTFYPAPDNLLNLTDNKNNILYIFDPDTKIFPEKQTIISEVKYLSWHENGSLLFINDYEIWTYQKHDGQYIKNLITRLSSKINHALWFTYDTHLIYLTDSGLYITEVVTSDNKIVKYEKIKTGQMAYLTKNGEKIILLTNDLIYKSDLQ